MLRTFVLALTAVLMTRPVLALEPVTEAVQLESWPASVLVRPAMHSHPRGAVILLSDPSHAVEASQLESLRIRFSNFGWRSIAARPAAFTLGEVDASQQVFTGAVTELLTLVSNQQGFTLVIAEGQTAAMLIRAFGAAQLPLPDGLVLIGSYLPQQDLNLALAEQQAALGLPLLDLDATTVNRWNSETIELRRAYAEKALALHHRHVQLLDASDVEEVWRQIQGWMRYNGF